VAEIYTEPKEFKRYALVPAPPKWELQEYIVAFFKEKDNKYLAWFLHYYENTLNTNVQKYMKQFFMPEHFTDIKQAYIVGLLKALENYDISIGVPFAVYKERYAEREVLDYIRSIRTGYTAQSLAEFAKLRKAMAIWDKYERSYTDEMLKMIADEMGEETDAVKDILLSGLLNENAEELYRKYADEDGEESTEEIVPDNSNNPSYLFFKSELYSCLWEAFDKLSYEEQSMLAQHFGFCLNCKSVFYMDYKDLDEYGEPKKKQIPKMMYTDIATDHEYSSANTAKKICEKSIEKLKEMLESMGV